MLNDGERGCPEWLNTSLSSTVIFDKFPCFGRYLLQPCGLGLCQPLHNPTTVPSLGLFVECKKLRRVQMSDVTCLMNHQCNIYMLEEEVAVESQTRFFKIFLGEGALFESGSDWFWFHYFEFTRLTWLKHSQTLWVRTFIHQSISG